MSTIGHLINGQIVTDENRTQPVFNPSTGDSTRQVALASKATVEQAIAAAETAYHAWRATPPPSSVPVSCSVLRSFLHKTRTTLPN